MNGKPFPLLFLLCGLVLSGADQVSASPGVETRFLDEQARQLFVAGRYDAALSTFLELQRATPSAEGAYNVAVCAELASNLRLAFLFLDEYFRLAPSGHPFAPDARKRKEALSRELALVLIESTPPGATIYVDREELGSYGTTPQTVVVDQGEHEIILRLDDFESKASRVVAQLGQIANLNAALVHETGFLAVSSNVPAFEIIVNVSGRQEKLRFGKNRVDTGAVTVTVSASGFRSEREQIVLAPGDERSLHLNLKRLPLPTGRLLVDAGEYSAKIFVDGQYRGQTPATVPSLPLGVHRLRVEAPGFSPRSSKFEVEKGRASYQRIDFELPEKNSKSRNPGERRFIRGR